MSELANIQSDVETRDKLRKIAEYHVRSMAGQLRWLVNREYDRIFNDGESAHAPTIEATPIVHEGVLP